MTRGVAVLSAIGLYFLYFFGLTRTGLVGPDEPRYAAIGRAMASAGDWITPRLWGQPWFEKPALLYWMTATGFKLGFGTELAPRLPVVLVSIAFLVYFFFVLRREFDDRVAAYSTTILATSAGWLVYSHVAVTDLPMSAALAAAMLAIFSAPPLRSFLLAGIFLGLAVLAKGLVPLVLFIPALWFLRHRVRDLAMLFGAAILVAAPWYVLVTLRNGSAFIDEFFWKQHFGRFLTGALEHGQPVWFYVPVLLAVLFPWIPLVLLLFNRSLYRDRRARFLLAWIAWGFVFFSASHNKLPGYLLPLLPPVAALIGIALAEERARSAKLMALLGLSAVLLCIVPTLDSALPQALVAGLSRTPYQPITLWLIPALLLGLACAWCEKNGRRNGAVAAVAVGTVLAVVSIAWLVYPALDRELSGRGIATKSMTCLPPMNRSQRYSTQYYAGRSLLDCSK
jgi:4-amino-4-deoxy-L-arabinose transferase-like glycosyltransferase